MAANAFDLWGASTRAASALPMAAASGSGRQFAASSPPGFGVKGSRTITLRADRSFWSRNVILPGGVVTIFPIAELGMPSFADSLAQWDGWRVVVFFFP